MPKFEIELNDGRKFEVDADRQPTPEEVVSFVNQGQGGSPQRATKEQFLTPKERFETGLAVDPIKRVDQLVAERGLPPGTSLEPTPQTASLVENVKDIPNDLLDVVGPAFPAIGQFLGGIVMGTAGSAIPGAGTAAGVAAGGTGGAMGGEALRQALGAYLKVEENPGMSERAKRLALEGALGAAGEGLYIGGNMLLQATKKGIVKAGEKAMSKSGMEGFTKGYAKIVNNVDSDKLNFALKASRTKDKTVFSKKFADKNFSSKLSERLFFGKDKDAMKQISKLSARPNAKEPVRELYQTFFPHLTDDTIELAAKHGVGLRRLGNPKNVSASLKKLNSRIGSIFDKTGKELGKARKDLVKSAKNLDVSPMVTQINKQLGDSLADPARGGLLQIIDDGVYAINPNFATTSTGRAQGKTFAEFITKMFGKSQKFSPAQEASLRKAIISGNKEAIEAITRGKHFTANVSQTYEKFANKLGNLDIQISGKEFDAVGKLSPELTQYLKGLRQITDTVADKVGDVNVKFLNSKYKTLVENLDLVRSGAQSKNIKELEVILGKFVDPKTSIDKLKAESLELFLKENMDSNIFTSLRAFKALKQIDNLNDLSSSIAGKQKFINFTKEAFQEGRVATLEFLERVVDPVLPDLLKPALNSKRHTVALALHNDALSILKGRFLSSGLGIPAALGTATGGFIGGFEGATAGLGIGLALQNPAILRSLIKMSGKAPLEKSLTVPGSVSRPGVVGGVQLIKSLIQQAQAQ